jgi:hypothetical protein
MKICAEPDCNQQVLCVRDKSKPSIRHLNKGKEIIVSAYPTKPGGDYCYYHQKKYDGEFGKDSGHLKSNRWLPNVLKKDNKTQRIEYM